MPGLPGVGQGVLRICLLSVFTIADVKGKGFAQCGNTLADAVDCCQADSWTLWCAAACPDGFFASTTACQPATTATNVSAPKGELWNTTESELGPRTGDFNVSCCTCSEACLQCYAPGPQDCYHCADGYVLTADQSRCVASQKHAADINVALIFFLVSAALCVLTLSLAIVWYRKNCTRSIRKRKTSNSTFVSRGCYYVSQGQFLQFLEERERGVDCLDILNSSSSEGSCHLSTPSPASVSDSFERRRGFVCPAFRGGQRVFLAADERPVSIASQADDSGDESIVSAEVVASDASQNNNSRTGSSHFSEGYFERITNLFPPNGMLLSQVRNDIQKSDTRSTTSACNFSSPAGDEDSEISVMNPAQSGSEYSFETFHPKDKHWTDGNVAATYIKNAGTQTVDATESIVPPCFRDFWDCSDVITSQGGVVQGPDSDVRIEFPPKAVEEGLDVTVRVAVCVDLETVHTNFGLPLDEHIVSPVAELTVDPHYTFDKAVRIVLPHFLPHNFSREKVKVYQCYTKETGDWVVNTLPQEERENSQLAPDTREETGVFCLAESSQVHVLTQHFSVYFCTDCGTSFPPPELFLRVFANHAELSDEERQVDIRLDIWDNRLQIKDFQKILDGRDSVNYRKMHHMDTKQLPALAETAMGTVSLKASLELKRSENRLWMHAQRQNGDLVYPMEVVMSLTAFVPCACRRPKIPCRVDWQLTNKPGCTPTSCCGCYIDVGYVAESGNYLDNPRKVTIDVSIPMGMDNTSKPDSKNRLSRHPNSGRMRYNNLAAESSAREDRKKPARRQAQCFPSDSNSSDEEDTAEGASASRQPRPHHKSGLPSSIRVPTSGPVVICQTYNDRRSGGQSDCSSLSEGPRCSSTPDPAPTDPENDPGPRLQTPTQAEEQDHD